MAIYHQNQVVRLIAGADLSACEGCFVTVDGATLTATLTTASTSAFDVFGVVDSGDAAGKPVDIILTGCAGIVGAKLHSSSGAATVGCKLYLAANGTVKTGTSGTWVATALAAGSAGNLVKAQLVPPTTLT